MDENKQNTSDGESQNPPSFLKRRSKEMAFMTGVAGISIMGGFGYTLGVSKKKDPNMFNQGLMGAKGVADSGGSLALRALGWGTLYSFTGVGLLCFGIWKLMAVKNMEEFRSKVQRTIPAVPKKENQGRNDFKSIRELFDYIIDEDKKKKGHDR